MMKKIINLKGISVEYMLDGNENGKTILFVHGLGAHLSQFEKQYCFFHNEYQVLSLNLQGHGNTISSRELSHSDFGIPDMCRDVVNLLDALKIEKVHFAGNSMGGNIGYELLKTHADRLLSLTIFGTTAELNMPKMMVKIMQLTYRLLSTKSIAKLSSYSGRTDYSKNKIYEMFLQTSRKTILNIIPHLAKIDYINTIKTSQIPTLIIKGEHDKEINKKINSTIAAYDGKENSDFLEMKGVGHFANLDNPDDFNKILKKFIDSI